MKTTLPVLPVLIALALGLTMPGLSAGEADPDLAQVLNPGAAVRNAPAVGPAVRPDDHRLGCRDLRAEYERLAAREAELAEANAAATRRDDVGSVAGLLGIVSGLGAGIGNLFEANDSVTSRDTSEMRIERGAVSARLDRVAELLNGKKC